MSTCKLLLLVIAECDAAPYFRLLHAAETELCVGGRPGNVRTDKGQPTSDHHLQPGDWKWATNWEQNCREIQGWKHTTHRACGARIQCGTAWSRRNASLGIGGTYWHCRDCWNRNNCGGVNSSQPAFSRSFRAWRWGSGRSITPAHKSTTLFLKSIPCSNKMNLVRINARRTQGQTAWRRSICTNNDRITRRIPVPGMALEEALSWPEWQLRRLGIAVQCLSSEFGDFCTLQFCIFVLTTTWDLHPWVSKSLGVRDPFRDVIYFYDWLFGA